MKPLFTPFAQSSGERAAVVCNVADSQQIDTAFDSFKQAFDRLDVLVNNAGVAGPIGPVEDINVTDWQQTIDINLNSMFYLTRLAIPLMKQTAQRRHNQYVFKCRPGGLSLSIALRGVKMGGYRVSKNLGDGAGRLEYSRQCALPRRRQWSAY